MTDEQRLHGMMADPGPAPTYDAHGFPLPFQVGDRVVNVDGDWCTVVEPGMRVALASGVPNTGVYWDDPATLRHLDERLAAATDSAGPVSSSASTSGTGGLDELLARLQAEVQSLAGMAQATAKEVEGQRRAAWDSLIESARRQEQVPSDTQAGYTMGWRAAHDLLTGRHLEDHEYEALVAAELDSRYGTDRTRAKGGKPTTQPEPPVGAVVRDGSGGDVWQRYADRGWFCVTGGSLVRSGITWAELNEDFGPVELCSSQSQGGEPS